MNQITEPGIYEEFADFGNAYENASDGPLTDESPCAADDGTLRLYQTVFQPLVYSVVFLLGLLGNGLLLTVLLQRRSHLRITEIYLLHLALADLLLLLTFPFQVVQALTSWPFGEFVCKLINLINFLNMVCGSLLLACIGFDRYLAIVHAISSIQSRRRRSVHLICAVLWLFCLGVTLPNLVFYSVKPNRSDSTQLDCYFHSPEGSYWLLTSRFLTHILCFFLPLVIMIYCYTAVVITLNRTHQSLEKQGAIRLAMVITLVFCLCWLPYNITLFLDTLVILKVIPETSCNSQYARRQGLIVTESIGFVHCCLNPILYAFVGVRFRHDLLRLLAKWGCGQVCAPVLRAGGLSRVSVSEAVTTTTSNQYV